MVGVPKRLLADAGVGADDAIYARLVEVHERLSPGASEILNARLVLILAKLVGDERCLQEALAEAMEGLDPDAPRIRPSA
jgi:hypothetical protein